MWARYVPNGDIGPNNDGRLYWLDDTNNEDIFDFIAQANAQNLGGHSDWRVPNMFELESLVIEEGSPPLIDHDAFPNTPTANYFWSSTTYVPASTSAIAFSFGIGRSYQHLKESDTDYIRAVRGGIDLPADLGDPALTGLLLKTGQTVQYSGKEDDGYFKKGVPKHYMVLDSGQYAGTVNITLNSKTHVLSNNCVQDDRTGLMWARYVPDGDIGPDSNGRLLWIDDVNNEDIFDFAAQANTQELGGHSDWRVPNRQETESLIIIEGSAPYIDQTTFPSTPSFNHWTSTTYALDTAKA